MKEERGAEIIKIEVRISGKKGCIGLEEHSGVE